MVITRIERQKKNPRRVNIFCDDEFTVGVHEDVLLKAGLRKGDTLDEHRLHELELHEEENLARERSFRFIGYRQRSEKEIRTKLLQNEFLPSIIDSTIIYLKNLGYVDDRAFAEAYVHDTLMKKPSGKRLLRRQLRLKGIAVDIIDDVLQKIGNEEELSLAREAARKHVKRSGTSRKPSIHRNAGERLKQRKRLADYLARRGFAWDTVSLVVKELFNQSS